MTFRELVQRVCTNQHRQLFEGKLLSIDPGETIGWCVFEEVTLKDCGQIAVGKEGNFLELATFMLETDPQVVVCESYRVYSGKSEQHVWNDLYTPRLIGAVQLVCASRQIPLYLQAASTAKGFCTDSKLKTWGFYKKGQKHARDAIRHACYWLLFNKEE